MKLENILQEGGLAEALRETKKEAADKPNDIRLQTYLFELFCFAGDLAGATAQLDALSANSMESDIAVQRYRGVLSAEGYRREVLQGTRVPGLPKTIPGYLQRHLEAFKALNAGDPARALAFLEEAEEEGGGRSASVNGSPFEVLRDADDRFGAILEVFTASNYSWIPFSQIKAIAIERPKYLRDLIYLPAKIELDIGLLGEVYLPALYPGAFAAADDRIKLGRMTAWDDAAGFAIGSGQRLFASVADEFPILEIRTIEFETLSNDDDDDA